jgi:hypothetical protein
MSQLGKLVRDYLTTQAGYSATFPGGINPDSNPVDYPLPFATFQGISKIRDRLLSGSSVVVVERIQLTIVAMTRAAAQTCAAWVAEKLAINPALQTIGTTKVYYLRIEDESAQAELLSDGSDESARVVEIDIQGAYLEG